MTKLKAINISKWQGNIDAKTIHNEGQIQVVIMRSTEGGTYQDPKFVEYWNSVVSNNMTPAAYHNFHVASSTPTEQLQNINTTLASVSFDKDKHALAISVFPNTEEVTTTQRADNLHSFLELLKQDGYKHVYINTNNYEWNTKVDWSKYSDFSNNPLWISHWTNATEPTIPDTWAKACLTWTWWQYSCTGKVPGISGDVCTNWVHSECQDNVDNLGASNTPTDIL